MHSSIRLFMICDNMQWSHLPVEGGIYAQHPKFLEEVQYIFGERAKHEAEEQRKRDAKNKRSMGRHGR